MGTVDKRNKFQLFLHRVNFNHRSTKCQLRTAPHSEFSPNVLSKDWLAYVPRNKA
jgi:hypothetical protein